MVCLLSTSSPRARGVREREGQKDDYDNCIMYKGPSFPCPLVKGVGREREREKKRTKNAGKGQRPYSREVDVDDETSAGEVSATMVLYDGGNRGASPAVRGM